MRRARIASTRPSPALGVALARPDWTARAAISATVDLDDDQSLGAQPARQAGAVAAGALDPDAIDSAEPGCPLEQRLEAGQARGDGGAVHQAAAFVEGGHGVHLGVGVDPEGDESIWVCHAGRGHPISLALCATVTRIRRGGGQHCDEAFKPGFYQVTAAQPMVSNEARSPGRTTNRSQGSEAGGSVGQPGRGVRLAHSHSGSGDQHYRRAHPRTREGARLARHRLHSKAPSRVRGLVASATWRRRREPPLASGTGIMGIATARAGHPPLRDEGLYLGRGLTHRIY